MKIALIHDYLIYFGGAEKTFKAITEIYPDADVFMLFYNQKTKEKFFPNKEIKTSFLQKFPFKNHYKYLLPLLPVAAESFNLRDYDLVISSSYSFAKGIITRPKTKHICYCYSPTRYLWDKNRGNIVLNYFRIWDRQAADRVDDFIAISETAQQRIKKYYNRDSVVIYPPVEAPSFAKALEGKPNSEFYLIVSQLRKYKRVDLAVKAFNKLGLNLIIIGEGPEKSRLQNIAKNNIEFLGWQDNIGAYLQNCKAFIFPSDDDFGIAPIEAMMFGKPALAFKKGGAMETMIEGKTGEFFDFQNEAALADGIRRLRMNEYDAEFIKIHAQKFNSDRFRKEFKDGIERLLFK